jgi:hypothetical protein
MRAWVIAAALCACGNKTPKMTPAWKSLFHSLAPDCYGDELEDNGSWGCNGDNMHMLITIQDGHLEHVAFWIGSPQGSEPALLRIAQVEPLVRPAVWAGVRAHINDHTKMEAEPFRDEDGRPLIRYHAGLMDHSTIYDAKTGAELPTYFVSFAWDDGY